MLISLLLIFMSFSAYFFWHIYYPCSKFKNTFWMVWYIIKGSVFKNKNMPLSSYFLKKLVQCCEKYREDGMCVIWLSEPFLYIFGENITKALSNDPAITDKPSISENGRFMLGTSVYMSNGETWKKQRKLLNPAFYISVLKDAVPVMNDHAESLVRELADFGGNVVNDIDKIFNIFSLEIFVGSTLGLKPDSPENKKRLERLVEIIPQLFEFLAHKIMKPWLRLRFSSFISSEVKKNLMLNKELQIIIKNVLTDLKKEIISRSNVENTDASDVADPCTKRKSMGEVLIEEHLKDPSFTMDDLMFQVIFLISAGFDTVANTFMWCFWLLGLHQDIQEEVYEEILSHVDGQSVQFEDLKKMTKLDNVIKESMRLYPAGAIFARYINKDVQFEKHIIPEGTSVVFFPFLLHRNPEIYPDPESFIPDRFIKNKEKIKPWNYIPFAEGTRSCLGKNFAMLEMKIVLAHVLRNYKVISLDKKEDVILAFEITLKSVHPLRIKFMPRNL